MLEIEQINDKCLLEQEVSNMLEIIHIYKRKVSFRTSDEMLKIVHTDISIRRKFVCIVQSFRLFLLRLLHVHKWYEFTSSTLCI